MRLWFDQQAVLQRRDSSADRRGEADPACATCSQSHRRPAQGHAERLDTFLGSRSMTW
jgi:hypothetical protein